MSLNQRTYMITGMFFMWQPLLFSSLEPQKSIDLLKTVMTFQRCYHNFHPLYSSRDWQNFTPLQKQNKNRQLVIKIQPGEKNRQLLNCWRIDSDNLLLLRAQTNDGGHIVIASCYAHGDRETQLADLKNSIDSHQGLKNYKAILLMCQNFPDITFLSSYEQGLSKIIGVSAKMLYYSMVDGHKYRDKDHFQCQIDNDKVTWSSAVDDFQDHEL